MNSKKLQSTLFTLALVFGLVACDKPGPAEKAGKEIDNAVEKASDKIEQVAEKLGEKTEKTVDKMDDALITTKIKAAMMAEPGLKTLEINVDTVDGVVTLSGTVNSQTEVNKAVEITHAVKGVSSVKDDMHVK